MSQRESPPKAFSLQTRLTVMLAVAVLVLLGGAARVVDWRADSDMQQRFDAALLARAQAFASLVHSGDSGVEVDAAADEMARFPGGALNDWYAVQCGGREIVHSVPAPPRLAAGRQPSYADARAPDGRRLRVVALRFRAAPGINDGAKDAVTHAPSPACTLQYALDRGSLDDILDTLDFILLGSLFGACVLVMLLTPWLVQRGLRPLAVLNDAMADIGPNTPGQRLPQSGTRELAPLVRRFNEVLVRMDAGLARERQFASGLAHEFRTRLAELRALVDVESRYPSGHSLNTILGEVGSIGTELEATVTALLQLTRIESGLEQMHRDTIPLAPLLARVQTRHADTARTRGVGIDLNLAGDSASAAVADPALLEIVLDNLLGNAIAYAPADSTVTLRGDRNGITVCNAAPALQPDDLVNFGQRFWRKDATGAGHAGLGLALATSAAQAMAMRLEFALENGVLHATLVLRAS